MLWNLFKRTSTSPPAPHLELGERGEQFAAEYLQRRGYKILVRGFRSRAGEIDLIARREDFLVFVEVKTRKSDRFGLPSDAVDLRKQRHIAKVAFQYVRQLKDPRVHIRFDIVEVLLRAGDRAPRDIRLIENAFELPAPYQY